MTINELVEKYKNLFNVETENVVSPTSRNKYTKTRLVYLPNRMPEHYKIGYNSYLRKMKQQDEAKIIPSRELDLIRYESIQKGLAEQVDFLKYLVHIKELSEDQIIAFKNALFEYHNQNTPKESPKRSSIFNKIFRRKK